MIAIAIIVLGLCAAYFIWDEYFNTALGQGECACCGHLGHRAKNCRHRFRVCTVCQERGHITSVCTRLTPDERSPYANRSGTTLLWILSWAEYLLRDQKREFRCLACGKWDHTSRLCRYLNRRCNRCRMKGHISAACPGNRIYRKYKYHLTAGLVVCVILFAKLI